MNRRDFLKSAVSGAALVALAPELLAAAPRGTAYIVYDNIPIDVLGVWFDKHQVWPKLSIFWDQTDQLTFTPEPA